ncbi:ribonuclease H-like superfamily protein [Striga asiatica]|uniref:Ribonuclease H-like superfamily protein n=1 Tax=Striga asiatica TaxID=4170 RepID=A0A5A7PXY2_STRAF|nr:ribonuclease H-like superfamily protein [Striga asiatica]
MWIIQSTMMDKSHLFHLIPILILWYLWCSRNDKRVKQIPFTAQRVCDRVWKHLQLIANSSLLEESSCSRAPLLSHLLSPSFRPHRRQNRPRMQIIRWTTPPVGTLKINTDGASKGNPREAGAGCYITPYDEPRRRLAERDLIQKIRALSDTLDVSFTHIYREGNSAVDYLAGSACRARDFVLYDVADLPGPLRVIIRMDLEYPSIRRPHDDIRPQG